MTPVTLYQSTDTDAPQLANAQGSLKTLLKACLVTGYGDKQPLGWAMPFEEDNKGVCTEYRYTDGVNREFTPVG